MALRYAVASGNWSSTSTWDGGTLPTASDDVFSNGFTVTINGTFTVLSIRNTLNAAAPIILLGGQFIYANGGNLTCTAAQAIYVGSTTPTLEMTLASPNTATFNGNVLTITNTNAYMAIRHSSTGTLNLNGNYTVDINNATKQIINVTSTGILNVVGNLSINSTTGGSGNATALLVGANATINITGDVSASGSSAVSASTGAAIYISSNSTVNITGNITNGVVPAIITIGANLNITGNITAATTPAIYNITSAATISAIGIITASSTNPAILVGITYNTNAASGTLVKVSGNVVNSTNISAIVAPRVTIDTNTSSWLFQISTGGNKTLYAPGVALGNPAIANVRFGTTYGASSELTGTLRVPTAANVLSGVLVDNTTGTLLMTPAQFWNYLIASGFTADSIGDRLQNAATVATVGGQIASYNI